MRTNRVCGKGAQSIRPSLRLGDSVISSSAAWQRCRFPAPRAGSVAAVVAGILGGTGLVVPAQAQNAAAGAQSAQATQPLGSAQTSQNLQEVVVTATATQVRKLDASYNVVSADNELIKESNPLSSADILKIAPGIWPEASGGQTGANIEVAGYPSGGDSPFFTNMIQGMPLYGAPDLAYMDSSSLFRLDETIERVEVVQGGPSVVFGPGQFGGTANYILKNGKNSPGGLVEATYGTEGMWRGDAYDGFQIADGWYGSLGGYYNVSHGVRDPQFNAIDGGQFTATLTHDISGGTVTAWARARRKGRVHHPHPVGAEPQRVAVGLSGFQSADRHVQRLCQPEPGTRRSLQRRIHEREPRQRPRQQPVLLRRQLRSAHRRVDAAQRLPRRRRWPRYQRVVLRTEPAALEHVPLWVQRGGAGRLVQRQHADRLEQPGQRWQGIRPDGLRHPGGLCRQRRARTALGERHPDELPPHPEIDTEHHRRVPGDPRDLRRQFADRRGVCRVLHR